MKLVSAFNAFEDFLATLGRWLQPVLLLVIRLYWGWSCARNGWAKLNKLNDIANYFATLHIPMPKLNAIAAASTEGLGGALLLLGLFTRFATPPLIVVMVVAYCTAEREALFSIYSDPDKFTGADPFLFLYAALIVFCFGPGKLSLDALLRKKSESGK